MGNSSIYNNQHVTYSIKRFENSIDKGFSEALKIYNEAVSVDTKTASNEISLFADNQKIQEAREMYFFGLFVNNLVIGFVEAGYLKETKSIILDYIVLKKEYHLNSSFYPLFGLLLEYFSNQLLDYDFIITEVSNGCINQDFDAESVFTKKMLLLEDFKIIDNIYIQPKLGIKNAESNREFQLMIKSARPIISLKKETYLSIIKDIYYNHYMAWYEIADKENSEMYKTHIDSIYKIICQKIEKVNEISISSIPECNYYNAPDCHYGISTAGFNNTNPTRNRPILLIGVPIMICIVFLFSLGILYFLNKLKITTDVFAPIFAVVNTFATSVFVLAFTKIQKNN